MPAPRTCAGACARPRPRRHEALDGDGGARTADFAEKGRAGQIPAIRNELQALVDRAQGRVAVELTTALELSDDEAASIVEQIEQASGRTVEATRSVDPDLIGGLILQAGSLRVDASVRGRLSRLRRELVHRG